jgi:hypothetical protein
MADMNAITRSGFVLAVIVSALALLGSPAGATAPTEASGTIQETALVPTGLRMGDGNLFISMSIFGTYSGTYAGDFVQEVELIVHSDGSVNFHGTAVCACTVAGVGSGTLVWSVTGTGTPTTGAGTYTIVSGTGDLESARGQGTFTAAGGIANYSGRQHYEP